MISVDISVKDDITKELKSIQRQLKKYPDEAHAEFVALTPVRTGNARRNTRLRKETIVAHYPYAERLDQGWSKQAPRGMTIPFDAWVEKKLKSIFGK